MKKGQKGSTVNVAKIHDAAALYRSIRDDYAFPEGDIFADGDERARRLKYIIGRLPLAEKSIIQLYAEVGNVRELGQMLGIPKSTMAEEVRRIRLKVLAEYERLKDTEI